jgi:hypothetical protein
VTLDSAYRPNIMNTSWLFLTASSASDYGTVVVSNAGAISLCYHIGGTFPGSTGITVWGWSITYTDST